MGFLKRLCLSCSGGSGESAELNDHTTEVSIPSESREPPPVYESLDEFTRLRIIGTGTFGQVRLCRCTANGKYYALKILRKTQILRLRQVEHVMSEKSLLKEIHHPFIVNLVTTFKDARHLYLLMDYVPGGELFTHLRRANRFSEGAAKFYAASIVLAFQYLHSKDIIYRDLKPENLLLDRRGYVRITDFGFAKRVTDRTWTLCGTPEYIAPEVIQSKGHGKGVDYWALGILIYEMLSGYPPFWDDNPLATYRKILSGKFEFSSHIGAPARDLVKRLLTVDRSRRLGNMRGGVEEIKSHRWFEGTDFVALFHGRIDAPIVPEVNDAGDAQNFEDYPDTSDDPYDLRIEDSALEQLFRDF